MINEILFAIVIGAGFGLAVGTTGEMRTRAITATIFGGAAFSLYDPFIGILSTATYVFIAFCPLCFLIHCALCCRWTRAEKKAKKAKADRATTEDLPGVGSEAGVEVPFTLYRYHPANWGFVNVLPFPGLDHLLLAYRLHAPKRAEQAIERLKKGNKSHRVAAMLAEVRIVVGRLELETDLSKLGDIARDLPIGEGKYSWQPRLARAKIGRISDQHRVLKSLLELNNYLPHEQHIDPKSWQQKVIALIEEFQQAAQDFDSPLSDLFEEAGERWLATAMQEISLHRNNELHS